MSLSRAVHRSAYAVALILVGRLVLPMNAGAQAQSTSTAQPLDLVTISRIRDEGLNHSRVMEYTAQLADENGPRLTGSPGFQRAAEWSIHQLQSFGIANAHEESWGDFGMSWTQIGTGLLLSTPSSGTLVAQSTPWSPPTPGEITAPVVFVPLIMAEEQLENFRGKLRGKIILYGAAPPVNLNPKSPIIPVDDAYFRARMEYPLNTRTPTEDEDMRELQSNLLRRAVGQFFAAEGALAVLCSPRGGDANTFRDDDSLSMGWLVFQKDHRQPIPSAVVAPDSYGRLVRLNQRGVPVTVRLSVNTRFSADHVDGQNVIGEIPGTDPKLRDEVVMFGAHLDSWASATGATDDGAGVAIALEALRILKATGVKPRRSIRIGLWGGEEEGELGSLGYVNQHFAHIERSSSPAWKMLPEWQRPAIALSRRPEYDKLDVYFNVDAGAGRILGVYTENNLAAAEVFRQWLDPIRDLGVDKVSTLKREGVDIQRFDTVGLPGFEFMQDLRDYDTRTHHTNLDTWDRISEPDLKQAATVMAIFVFNAAQRDAMIPRKVVAPPGLLY